MSDNINDTVAQLEALNLSKEEAKIYLELLIEPGSHLQLSRATGINRTKVYRIVERLERLSLVARRTDDRGMFLVAADPSTLEVALAEQEEKLRQKRELLHNLAPRLAQIQNRGSRAFVVRTYEGAAGLKQMLWHELKTKGEIVSLGNGTVEQESSDTQWARAHRDRQIAAGYRTRDIVNYEYTEEVFPELASKKLTDAKLYSYRILSPEIVRFDNQTSIYNDTVAIYHWNYDQKVGVEIINAPYASMMRQVFEHYWNMAS